tara:strand:- start:231 stop:689 length:459 start_codon:yes stop_codon:yes gene_type:complete
MSTLFPKLLSFFLVLVLMACGNDPPLQPIVIEIPNLRVDVEESIFVERIGHTVDVRITHPEGVPIHVADIDYFRLTRDQLAQVLKVKGQVVNLTARPITEMPKVRFWSNGMLGTIIFFILPDFIDIGNTAGFNFQVQIQADNFVGFHLDFEW